MEFLIPAKFARFLRGFHLFLLQEWPHKLSFLYVYQDSVIPHLTTMPSHSTQGSSTQTQTQQDDEVPTLHLKVVHDKNKKKNKKKVEWSDDVIDNEFLNKKKSKICCIFHPQNPEEYELQPSSDSDSSSESDSESDEDLGEGNAYERQPKYSKKHTHNHDCHEHTH